MSVPVDGSPVPGEHRVLRLPLPPKDFTPDGWRPTHQEFEPTGDEKQDAARRGQAVRVSVWDATLTSVAQACAFRARAVIVISASTAAILAAGATAIVYDTLSPADSERPGAAGHAGIEGLDRAKGEQKTGWRARLQDVAECFTLQAGA